MSYEMNPLAPLSWPAAPPMAALPAFYLPSQLLHCQRPNAIHFWRLVRWCQRACCSLAVCMAAATTATTCTHSRRIALVSSLADKAMGIFAELGRHVQWGGKKVQRFKKKQLLLFHNSPKKDPRCRRHHRLCPRDGRVRAPPSLHSALPMHDPRSLCGQVGMCDGAYVCLCCGQNFSWWRRRW
jgi:hypothetical protein